MNEEKLNEVGFVENKNIFKLVIPEIVEKTIREWCALNPSTEWSGTLFYTYEGSFKDNNIVFTVRDFLVSDIGTSGFTSYEVTPEICNYMLENDLMDCNTGLIHSHNSMAAFFSGTDNNTLKSEGCDTCHYLSLVVNNAGKYVARVTRRVNEGIIGKRIVSYQTYGGKTESYEEDIVAKGKDVVEYYNLDINIEGSTSSLKDKIKARYDELKAKIVAPINKVNTYPSYPNYPNYGYGSYKETIFDDDDFDADFDDRFNINKPYFSEIKNKIEDKIKSKTDNKVVSESITEINKRDAVEMAAQILYGNITLSYETFSKFTKVNSWVRTGMIETLNKRFHAKSKIDNLAAINNYDEFIYTFISMIVEDYVNENIVEYEDRLGFKDDDFTDTTFAVIVAKSINNEIDRIVTEAAKEGEFENPYIDAIKENLKTLYKYE